MDGFNVGLDGFYKSSHSTLDEGQFGQALILSSFNYKRGEIYGGEITSSYDHGPFSAYGNLAYEWARGTHWRSAQFLFRARRIRVCQESLGFPRPRPAFHRVGRCFIAGGTIGKLPPTFFAGNGLRHALSNSRKFASLRNGQRQFATPHQGHGKDVGSGAVRCCEPARQDSGAT